MDQIKAKSLQNPLVIEIDSHENDDPVSERTPQQSFTQAQTPRLIKNH